MATLILNGCCFVGESVGKEEKRIAGELFGSSDSIDQIFVLVGAVSPSHYFSALSWLHVLMGFAAVVSTGFFGFSGTMAAFLMVG